MSSMRARSLPRVREALEKAERARFYKQRTNKYTDEVRLMQSLSELENKRIAALARVKEQTMELRMQALSIRDEEASYLESDEAGLQELVKKVEMNKHRNFLQEVKYKPLRHRQQFVDRYERWKAEDAAQADWRVEMPPRPPQVQLNEQLIYPAKRERKQNRQMYLQITRRPDSKLGQKALQRLRRLYEEEEEGDLAATEAERAFFQELQLQLQGSDCEEATDEEQQRQQPFVTQQLQQQQLQHLRPPGATQSLQEISALRVLHQVEATRRAIRYWEVPVSEGTRHQLGECCRRRKYRVRRLRPRPQQPLPPLPPPDKATGDGDDGDAGADQTDEEKEKEIVVVEVADEDAGDDFQQQQQRHQSVRSLRKPHGRRVSTRRLEGVSEDPTTQTEDGVSGDDAEDAEERERVRRLSQRLSRGFRPEDFNRRRQSLMRELDEEEVSPAERKRRMAEFERAWAEVLKCKYIRGYEPPDMRLPDGQSATDFVFGEAQARELDSIVEEASAAAAAAAAAEAATAADTSAVESVETQEETKEATIEEEVEEEKEKVESD